MQNQLTKYDQTFILQTKSMAKKTNDDRFMCNAIRLLHGTFAKKIERIKPMQTSGVLMVWL